MKSPISKLPLEQKELMIAHIRHFFEEERGEQMGELAAGQVLDFMFELVGPVVYNQALQDAKTALTERMLSLEDDLYAMEKPMYKVKR
ncbi:DUF2164 domain-containing protein [Paenibacillus sp. MBLB4367]|uniref:DUF2164 domain-containing protein n=1 Tax=Paenibacillus sp. MBLB4367 TaxID=3384767 RepID=UPI003907E8C7